MLRISYVLAGLLACTTVYAEPDKRAQALQLFDDSDKAYKAGQFEKAADLLRKAYDLFPEPLLLYNLGRALEGLGDAKGAVEQYERYLHDAKEIPDRGAIERRVATLKAQLAKQETDAQAAEEARRAAEEARRTHVEPPPPSPPPAAAPMSDREPVTAQDVLPWATMGAGAALVITGGVFGLHASSNHDDAVAAPTQVDALRLQNSATHDAKVANVLFALGGAAIIGGAIWEYVGWWRGGGEPAQPTARLLVGPSSIGVAWVFP